MITTPIINILHDKFPYKDFDAFYEKANGNSKNFLKEKLGKQSYCLNLEKRFWVWEFENYRVFAANGYGISFEVVCNYKSIEECLGFLADFWRRLE